MTKKKKKERAKLFKYISHMTIVHDYSTRLKYKTKKKTHQGLVNVFPIHPMKEGAETNYITIHDSVALSTNLFSRALNLFKLGNVRKTSFQNAKQ